MLLVFAGYLACGVAAAVLFREISVYKNGKDDRGTAICVVALWPIVFVFLMLIGAGCLVERATDPRWIRRAAGRAWASVRSLCRGDRQAKDTTLLAETPLMQEIVMQEIDAELDSVIEERRLLRESAGRNECVEADL